MPTAESHEHVAALELLFRHLPPEEVLARIVNALPLLSDAENNGLRLFVARSAEGVSAAMMAQALPGGTGLVWPPQGDLVTEDALLDEALTWLRQSGVRIVQGLLMPEEAMTAHPLLRNGFTHATKLWYLQHRLTEIPTVTSLSFEPYGDSNRPIFQHTLARTYDGTCDFPEMNGVRTVEDVLYGHRAAGSDPRRWWLASADEPIGVLMLSPSDDGAGLDLSYVGVVPERRGQGFGEELVVKAMFEAKAASVPELTLSVDARNEPALRVYRKLGFEAFEVREVYLKII
jgi:mycothiol synthase